MKMRHGFVSNSSSSSFVCDVCGSIESGMDCGPKDLGFDQCPNEHYICESEVLPLDDTVLREHECPECRKTLVFDAEDEVYNCPDPDCGSCYDEDDLIDIESDNGATISELQCPICQLKALTERDQTDYLLQKLGMTEKEVLAEVQSKYKTYDKFVKSLTEREEDEEDND